MRKNNLFLFSAFILASCTVGPDYRAPGFLPEKQIAASLELNNTAGRIIPSDWYRQFNDQTLNYLIASGLRDSPNVAAAVRRLREARAGLNIARAGYLPVLNASGAYKYDKPGKNIGYELKNNYYQAGLMPVGNWTSGAAAVGRVKRRRLCSKPPRQTWIMSA